MDRKFKLDDSFKKALEEAVVSDMPATSWMDQYKEDYQRLVTSGAFFELHPTWTGDWDKDKFAFCYNKGWEKAGIQDPATIDKKTEIGDIDYMYKWIREKSGK
jgi:hypothetical protein